MDIVFLVARILFALIFIASGFAHFTNRKAMTEYAAAVGAPAPGPGVLISGLMILAGGLMIVLGIWGDLGALLLVAFLLPTTFIMHAFWKMDAEQDPQMAQLEQMQRGVDSHLDIIDHHARHSLELEADAHRRRADAHEAIEVKRRNRRRAIAPSVAMAAEAERLEGGTRGGFGRLDV